MGLCASLLKPEAKKKRYPEPRRGMPKALFVARGDRGQQQYYKPKPAEPAAHDGVPAGRSRRLHEPAGKVGSRRNEKWKYQGSSGGGGDALAAPLDRRLMPPLLSPVTTTMPCRRKTAATTDTSGLCVTRATPPMTPGSAPPMTPMRPVWQRRILMGMRCELPRFSGLILYDEHGRPIHIGTPSRRNYQQQRGKKKIARTSTATALRDLL